MQGAKLLALPLKMKTWVMHTCALKAREMHVIMRGIQTEMVEDRRTHQCGVTQQGFVCRFLTTQLWRRQVLLV